MLLLAKMTDLQGQQICTANLHSEAAQKARSMDASSEWVPRVCEKPRIKCSDCSNRKLAPLTDAVVYDHLAGKQTIGVFPLLSDDTCYFLAVDFDEQDWKEDAQAFMQSCAELNIP